MSKYCVISQVTRGSQHRTWIESTDYDCYFITTNSSDFCLFEYDGKLCFNSQIKNKFINYYNLLLYLSSRHYEYFLFLDCSINLKPKQILELFNIAETNDLLGAMPAITYDKCLTTQYKSQSDLILHYIDYLDNRCFLFSHFALSEVLETFKSESPESKWFEILGKPENKIAVIDTIEVNPNEIQLPVTQPHKFGFITLNKEVFEEVKKPTTIIEKAKPVIKKEIKKVKPIVKKKLDINLPIKRVRK